MPPRPLLSLCVVATCWFGAVACGSDSDDSAGTTPITAAPNGAPASEGATLTISDRSFSAVTVQVGQPIEVVNEDGFSHTVTDRDGAFDVKLAGGGNSLSFTIDEPGTYSIYCTIHPDMAGKIVVQ